MPRFTDDVSTPAKVRANDAVFAGGYHGESNFDPLTGLRKAQSVIHETQFTYVVPAGTAVASISVPVYGCEEVTEVVSVQAVPVAPPTGDYQYAIKLEAGNAATPYASVQTADLVVNSGSAARTPQNASLDSTKTTRADGDSLQLTITASGASGAQGTGLVVTVIVRKRPQA